ncbi:MAG: YtxH domain-containing protein [Thermomicrobia bacterium]|nr:YtxH domain-containing protein [Thermomicrobia bacterium]
MSVKANRADDRRRVAIKYLTIGLVIGLLCAPRAGADTIKACVASLQDLFGTIGGNEFAEPNA